MSGFIGAAQPNGMGSVEDLRLNRMDFQPELMFADIWAIASAPFDTPERGFGGGFIGGQNGDAGILQAVKWGQYDQAAGAVSRYGFAGVTRDVNGTAVGSCTVKLFRTADDSLIDTIVSDTSGNFLLGSAYYPEGHYIVAHKTGSPDIDGVTPNNLIGT